MKALKTYYLYRNASVGLDVLDQEKISSLTKVNTPNNNRGFSQKYKISYLFCFLKTFWSKLGKKTSQSKSAMMSVR